MKRKYPFVSIILQQCKPSDIASLFNISIEEAIDRVQNEDPLIINYLCQTMYAPYFTIKIYHSGTEFKQDYDAFFASDITPYYPSTFLSFKNKNHRIEYEKNIETLIQKYNITSPAQLGKILKLPWYDIYYPFLAPLNGISNLERTYSKQLKEFLKCADTSTNIMN